MQHIHRPGMNHLLGGEWQAVELRDELGLGLDQGVGEVAVLSTRYAFGEAECGSDVAVGRGVSMTAASGAVGLSNGGAGALAGAESTATLLAFRVRRASLEDGGRAERC